MQSVISQFPFYRLIHWLNDLLTDWWPIDWFTELIVRLIDWLIDSDPDTCDDGLSFEMTFRLDKDALKYNDMNYIVDSGASTFNSKGFTLYTVHGKLRADLALANQEFCVQIPVTVQKWQDVLITWKKSEGK